MTSFTIPYFPDIPALQDGEVIYPEYAILFLVPPTGRDLSMLNVHDSQTDLIMEPRNAHPGLVRDLIRNSIIAKAGVVSESRLPPFIPTPSTAAAAVDGTDNVRQRRGSNMGAMLQHGKKYSGNANMAMYNLLGYDKDPGAVDAVLPVAGGSTVRKGSENVRRDSAFISEGMVGSYHAEQEPKIAGAPSEGRKSVHDEWWQK